MLGDRLQRITQEAESLRTMAVAVTRVKGTGDHPAMDEALQTLRLAVSLSRTGVTAVEAWDNRGSLVWSTALDHPLGVCEPAQADLDRLILSGRSTYAPRATSRAYGNTPALCFGVLDRRSDGAINGFTAAAFQTETALNLMRRLVARQDGVITILRDRQMVLAGTGSQEIGSASPKGPTVTMEKSGDGTTVERMLDPTTGARKIVLYRDIPGTDLTIAIARDEEASLLTVREFQQKLRIAAANIFGIMTFLLIIVFGAWRRDKAQRESRAVEETTYARGAMLHEIASRSPDIIGALDESFHFIYVNESVKPVFGLEPSELIGRPAGLAMNREDRMELLAALRALPNDGSSHRVTLPVRKPDGDEVMVEFAFSHLPLPDVHGRTRPGWLFICRDVTTRAAAEQKLKEAIKELQQVAEHIPGILYRGVGTDGGPFRLHYVTQKNGSLFGYPEMLWQAPGFISSIAHPDDAPVLERFRDDLKQTGSAVAEYRLRHANGTYVWYRNSSTVVSKENGQYWLMGFVQDVTVEKDQDARLEEARRLLALNELASGIGHELGQPLQAISLSARNALMHLDRGPAAIPRVRDKLERISAMVERAGETVQRLRDLSDADSNEPAGSDVAEAVDHAIAAAHDRLDLVRVETHVTIQPDLPDAAIQPTLLRKVLTALLVNACDTYRGVDREDPDGRLVTIDARQEDGQI
jgi:PAS domain S-box-containing protein